VPLMGRLFVQMLERYATHKQERSALDFDDLEAEALRLLQTQPAIQARWQQQIRAILTDEFQDTNSRQRDLLALLNGNDGGKLFVVGDAKQSIYRFRGADVTVFRAERARIEADGGRHISLDTSYRAHAPLLTGLNDLLRPILGEQSQPARPWVEPFAPLEPHRRLPGGGFEAPYIELHLTVGSKGDGALHRAAAALVGRLVAWVEEDRLTVGVGDKASQISYGDVVILCRASTSFAAYEDALEQAGVPFLTVAGRGFYQRPEIRDLLNGLQALADPTDDLALAGLLRSPAVALADAALYQLQQARRQMQAASLWASLPEPVASLPAEDQARLARAVELIRRLHRQVGRVSVADLLKDFLDSTDYRAALLQAGQPRAARNVSKLLADAHTSGIVGVGEFLEYMQELRDSGTREGEARATAEGVVQLMTVHAAKGLEFPVVVIGDATYRPPGGSSLLLDETLGLLLPQKDEAGERAASYRLGKRRAEDQEQAEADRLLYVAATRAQEKLLVSGCIGLRKNGTPTGLGQWLGQLAADAVLGLASQSIPYTETGADVIDLPLQVGQTAVGCYVYEPNFALHSSSRSASGKAQPPAEKAVALPPPLLASLAQEEPSSTAAAEGRSQRVWRVAPAVERPRAPAWVVGKLVHAALAAWQFPDGQIEFAAWVEAQARSTGLIDSRQLADAVRETERLLRRFQDHPLYQQMDQARQRRHEVPYSLLVDGVLESGVIDALFLEKEGGWTLVEFKTDAIRNEADLQAILHGSGYWPQVRRYVQAVERLLGQRPRALLCWLNHRDGVTLTTVSSSAGGVTL